MTLHRRAFMFGTASLFCAGRVPATPSGVLVIEGPAFGTFWRAVLPAGSESVVIRRALQAIVASVDAAMSPFRADSEVSRFNSGSDTGWTDCSAPTCLVVSEALHVARLTGGAFDPTVGGIVGQYGHGPIRRRSAGDFGGISVDAAAVRKAQPDLTLDLCGIAKGHALDRMVDAIAMLGPTDFLVEIGGEVATRGQHPEGRPWQVAIESPDPGPQALQRVLGLTGEALATSGDRINGYVHRDRRYSHIIDPHLRRPSDSDLASVSVLAPTAMRADAMATGLFAMGHAEGPDFAARNALPALFLVRDRSGNREIATGAFASRVLA